MSVRAFRRMVIAGGLMLGAIAASGCGGDKSGTGGGDDMDAGKGGSDAGADGGKADVDAGKDAAGDGTITCGTTVCSMIDVVDTPVSPCCIADDVCGMVGAEIPGGVFKDVECMPLDAERASESSYCGGFFDQFDSNQTNGFLDVPSDTLQRDMQFEGCCLSTGECGAYLRKPDGLSEIDLRLGCIGYTVIADALASLAADGGVGDAGIDPNTPPLYLPFCNPEDEGNPPTEGTVPGAPSFVCGCGVDDTDDGEGLPCLNHLSEAVCGADDPTAEELAEVPEFLCGCGDAEPSALCLRNLAPTTCGAWEVTAENAAALLAGVPEFMCGCGDDAPNALCLRNLEEEFCGGVAVDEANAPVLLAKVPEFMCGCEGAVDPQLGCLDNVEATICGGLALNESSAAVDAVLSQVPEFVCGCGDDTVDSGFSSLCMSNVPPEVCGTKDTVVDTKDTEEPTDDCLVGVPEYAHGCGDGAGPSAEDPSCLRNAEQLPGCVDIPAAAAAQGLRRVPEYLCGCGEGSPTGSGGDASIPCLPLVDDTVCGAVPISVSAQVTPRLPNQLCGCGADGNTDAQCLDNVPPSVCGGGATCTNIGSTGGECEASEVCLDVFGGEGAEPGGQGGEGDGIGDVCQPVAT